MLEQFFKAISALNSHLKFTLRHINKSKHNMSLGELCPWISSTIFSLFIDGI